MKWGWLASAAVAVLTGFGVSSSTLATWPKSVLIAAAAVVVGAQLISHYATIRNADNAAAKIKASANPSVLSTAVRLIRADIADLRDALEPKDQDTAQTPEPAVTPGVAAGAAAPAPVPTKASA